MKRAIVTAGLVLFLAACGFFTVDEEEPETDDFTGVTDLDDDDDAPAYDPALLEKYRKLLPGYEELAVDAPGAAPPTAYYKDLHAAQKAARMALQQYENPYGTAMMPTFAIPIAQGVNELTGIVIGVIQDTSALEPSYYNEISKEFVWGPTEFKYTEAASDTIVLYMRDNGEDFSDFRYNFRVLTGQGNDYSTLYTIVWGGITLVDGTDDLWGVVVLDFEHEYQVKLERHEDVSGSTRGRFAALYVQQDIVENGYPLSITFTVAAFRDMIDVTPDPGEEPLNLNYFYGNVVTGDMQLDFLNFHLKSEITADYYGYIGPPEDIYAKIAFVNRGIGRGEMFVNGGSIDSSIYLEGVECWDQYLDRQAFYLNAYSDYYGFLGEAEPSYGDINMCTIQSLDEIPTLDDVDPELMNGLEAIATYGPPPDVFGFPLYTGQCTDSTFYPGDSTSLTLGPVKGPDGEEYTVAISDYLHCCKTGDEVEPFYCELSYYRFVDPELRTTRPYSVTHRMVNGKLWLSAAPGYTVSDIIAKFRTYGAEVSSVVEPSLADPDLFAVTYDKDVLPVTAAEFVLQRPAVKEFYFPVYDAEGRERVFDKRLFIKLPENVDLTKVEKALNDIKIDVDSIYYWGEELVGLDLTPRTATNNLQAFAYLTLMFKSREVEEARPLYLTVEP